MKRISLTALATAAAALWAAYAWADVPAAVVEEVSGASAGVEFMDYVPPGKVIKLGPRDTIVLGYLNSCWRETITGGTVTVGTEQSTVKNGKVERAQVQCGGGRMQLTSDNTFETAGYVSRDVSGKMRPRPKTILYGRLPIIELAGPGTLLIERLDGPSERYEFAVEHRELVRGSFFDFARARRVLSAGGTYRATFGAKQTVFRVDKTAAASAPVVARLLRF
jgi:hypothetical protein